jgi:N-acetylglucosamine kinase-like BadF-type ATPase
VRPPLVLAIDGGNSKTDLALVRDDGEALALVRGPMSSPQHLGIDGCFSVLGDLLGRAFAEAGLPARKNGRVPAAEVAQLSLAGVDFPSEEREVGDAASKRRLASTILVGNDTLALLRAGTERGWGVAVVCGAGINCVGVAPDGRHARFPALGWITGDWGGGDDVGPEAVAAAARSEDGRGEKSTLEHAVPAYFGFGTPTELAEAFHRNVLSARRAVELAPVVFSEARRDRVAAGIVDRLAEEVVVMIRVTLERLGMTGSAVEVVLGGGLLQAGDERLVGGIQSRLAAVAPAATAQVTSSPPVVGAALLGLDQLGAPAHAQARARTELGDAFRRMDGVGLGSRASAPRPGRSG